jgi:hypothetical protein
MFRFALADKGRMKGDLVVGLGDLMRRLVEVPLLSGDVWAGVVLVRVLIVGEASL